MMAYVKEECVLLKCFYHNAVLSNYDNPFPDRRSTKGVL
jgi:hypothetical protein